jgi:hypothetical protein
MKKVSVIAILFLILFGACNKEHGNDSDYHVSFTVDGVNKSYTAHVLAHKDTTGGYVTLTILGANSPTSFDNYMGIYLDNFPGHGNFTPVQYDDNSATFTLLANYTNNAIEYDAGQSIAQDAVTYGVTIAHHFKVNITSIDNNVVRGTFNGDYYKDGDVQSSTKLNITNGDFYVRFQ